MSETWPGLLNNRAAIYKDSNNETQIQGSQAKCKSVVLKQQEQEGAV